MSFRLHLLAGIAVATLSLPAVAQESATPPAAPAPYTPPAASGTEAPAAAPTAPAAPAAPDAAPATPEAAPAAPAAAAATAPAAEDAVAAAIAGLPTGIEDVQVVAPWTDGDKSGVWRTAMVQVGTDEKESYRFFIQQVEKAAGVATVLTTTEIKEIPGINGAVVGYRADEPSEDDAAGLTLFFDIVPGDGEIAETYELHFQKDRTYTFGPATN
jgi:hypothetical protein